MNKEPTTIENMTTDNDMQQTANNLPMKHKEVDLQELFSTLWKGKFIIFSSIVVFTIAAIVYAKVTPEQWTASGKIIQPRINDYYQLDSSVRKFEALFEKTNNNDISKTKNSNPLIKLIESKELYQQYIQAFNSTINKKKFLSTSSEFQAYLTENNITATDKTKIIQSWYENFQAIPGKNESISSNYYTVSLKSNSQESSYTLLTTYSKFIEGVVKKEIIDGINQAIDSYRQNLESQAFVLNTHAKNILALEKEKASIAYDIASKANINTPYSSYNESELFSINLGKNAYLAKIEALDNLKNLSIIEPKITNVVSKLAFLKQNSGINPDTEFNTVRYLEKIELPVARDKPNRALIAILGTLIGLIFGASLVLLKKTFIEKK